MSHAFVTIVAAVPADRIAALRAAIEALGNPASAALAAALDAIGKIHFASLNVFEASAGDRGHLVFEFSGDGAVGDLLGLLDQQLSRDLTPIFAQVNDRGSASLREFWQAHVVPSGQSLFANPGVNFTGTPGLSVERIRRERALALHVAGLLPEPQPGVPALRLLSDIRAILRSDPQWSWALEVEPIAQGGTVTDLPQSFAEALPVVIRLAGPFARTFLWPLAIPIAIAFVLAWWNNGFTLRGALPALGCAGLTALLTAIVAIGAAVLLYRIFRRRENAEAPIDRPPDRGAVAAIMKRENHAAQNHLAGLSIMKTGRLRRFTLTLAFWSIAQLAARFYRAGFLGSLGSIHFARWVVVPGTRDLLFLSNYGGSWESYLEDFITKAHTGLTGVWSNTVDFPKASNLFFEGATDGERFKRWARRQQMPTAFWYSAYPDLTTTNIRTNAVIRQGLGAVMMETEARQWLSLFGSAARPVGELESHEIQSLVFGGLGFLTEGRALLFSLSGDTATAKAWLQELLPSISFADGRSLEEAAMLGLAAPALSKLGLPEDSITTFPPAFTDGMAAPWRSRALGDVGGNAPDTWWWGGDAEAPLDGVLLLYAKKRADLDRLHARLVTLLEKHGHVERRTVTFRSLAGKDATPEERFRARCEPFGFLDGISQPVIRGTYKALRGADPIHLLEPGEFILGYPDNRGNVPPSPVVAAINDPANLLPIAPEPAADFSINTVNADRDLGRNGSFLAIRQLEQNVEEFEKFCKVEGERLEPHFPLGVKATAEEYIAAKMVGRWKDGSPLSRYPRYPASNPFAPGRPLSRTAAGGSTPQVQAAANIPSSPATATRPVSKQAAAPSSVDRDSDSSRETPEPNFEPDNDFLFGSEDPQGLRCPFGAHIRRANPRESFDPGSHEQLGITNRHRIMRVGRFYKPQEDQKAGLFFMCLNGDLERQFEFVQQTWIQSPSFQGLVNERDPLIGERSGQNDYTIPTRGGPMRLANLPAFVNTRGGGYFFLPGRRTLQYLAS